MRDHHHTRTSFGKGGNALCCLCNTSMWPIDHATLFNGHVGINTNKHALAFEIFCGRDASQFHTSHFSDRPSRPQTKSERRREREEVDTSTESQRSVATRTQVFLA